MLAKANKLYVAECHLCHNKDLIAIKKQFGKPVIRSLTRILFHWEITGNSSLYVALVMAKMKRCARAKLWGLKLKECLGFLKVMLHIYKHAFRKRLFEGMFKKSYTSDWLLFYKQRLESSGIAGCIFWRVLYAAGKKRKNHYRKG